MPDSSVVLKLIDQYSTQAKSIESANKGLSKSMEEAQRAAEQQSKRLGELQSMAAGIKTSMAAAKQALQDAEKQFRATGEAADADALKAAHEKYDALKSDLSAVTREAKDAEKALYNAGEQARRLSTGNAGGSGGSGGGDGGDGSSVLSLLGKSGLVKQLGSAISGAVSYGVSSAYGETAGTYFDDILGGVVNGAAAGTLMGGPVGTVVGGLIGGVSGLISASVKDAQKDDELFRSGVQGAYDSIMEYRDNQVSTGSEVYGGRETLLLSYKTLMGGNAEAAQNLYDDLLTYANRTPYTLGQLSGAGRTLLAYGYEGEQIQGVLNQIGAAAAATGSGAEGLSTIATVIGRMNTGEISARLFRSLNALGMNSYQTLADAYNAENGTTLTSAEMKQYVSKGKVTGEWAAQALLDQWGTAWGASVEEFSKTFEGLTSTVEGLRENRQALIGEQYDETRKGGITAEITHLNSDLGQTVSEIEGYYGIVQATAENTQERMRREAEDALINGNTYAELGNDISASLAKAHEEYLDWKAKLEEAIANDDTDAANEARMNLYRLLDGVRADAEAAYTNSDFFHTMQKGNLQLVEDLQASTYDSWYNYGRMFGEAFSKGAAAYFRDAYSNVFETEYTDEDGDSYTVVNINDGSSNSHAYGLHRVPYNGYVATLHQDERVLTAAEARQADAGGTGGITINLGGVTVRDETDAEMVAEIIVQRLIEAKKTYVG